MLAAPTAAGGQLLRQRHAALARYLLLGAGGVAAAYAAYRLYHSDGLAEARRAAVRLHAALTAYTDAFGTGAASLQMLAADLHAFLRSDGHEVPPSLRQLARLMQSPEVADTTSATVAALLRGVSGGPRSSWREDGHAVAAAPTPPTKPALDRILDALMSDRGHSLVSVAVSLGARNLMSAYCETKHRLGASDRASRPPQPDLTNRLLDFLASPRGQQLAVMSVTAFVTSGMRAYLDQTLDLNFYEDLFSAMAKPQHLEAVKAVVGVFARDVVGTYMAPPAQPQLEAPAPAAQQQPGLRLSASIQELLRAGGRPQQQQQEQAAGEQQQEQAAGEQQQEQAEEAGTDAGSPCGSSVSGAWQQQAVAAAAAAPAGPTGSDVDSDVLLHPHTAAAAGAKGGSFGQGADSARSHEGGWAVRTPAAATEPSFGRAAAAAAAAPMPVPVLRQLQQEERSGDVMQRTGSGNLEWISAVSKEWLNVAQHPQGRTIMVELAGTAAKEAARGVSAALADRFRTEWVLLAALAMLLLAWLAQRMLGVLLG